MSHISKNMLAKYIQTFIDYNIPSNEWEYRIYKIRTYKLSDSSSLGKMFYAKGFSGLYEYKRKKQSCIQNLERDMEKKKEISVGKSIL